MDTCVYTVQDIAIALSCGKAAAYALMRSEAFPSFRLGKKYLVSKPRFEEWLSTFDKSIQQVTIFP